MIVRLPAITNKYPELIFPETELRTGTGEMIGYVEDIKNLRYVHDVSVGTGFLITLSGVRDNYFLSTGYVDAVSFEEKLVVAAVADNNDLIWYHYNEEGVDKKIKRRIVSAADRYDEIIIPANRHGSALMNSLATRILGSGDWDIAEEVIKEYRVQGLYEQGFIDNYGEFWTREQAMVIAAVSDQLIRVTGSTNSLFSEDIY